VKVLAHRLNIESDRLFTRAVPSRGPGNVVLVKLEFEQVTEIVSAFGRRGLPAEQVAENAAQEAEAYLTRSAPVGPHLADQLLIPLAVAGEGRFRTTHLTGHTTTNMKVIERFVEVQFSAEEEGDEGWQIGLKRSSS